MIVLPLHLAVGAIIAWLIICLALAAFSFRYAWSGWLFLASLTLGLALGAGFGLRGVVVWPIP